MVDPQTAQQVQHIATTTDWAGVSVLLVAILPFYYKMFFPGKKQKSDGITKEELQKLLNEINILCPISQKDLFEELENRVLKNKEYLEDLKSEVRLVKDNGGRIEDAINRVSTGMADLVQTIRLFIK
jgi:hypothetical protein